MNLTSKYLPRILEAWAMKLIINWVKDPPHILCLSEHHLSTEVIQIIVVDNYNLGAYYCRKFTKCAGYVYFFINLISL